MFESASATEDIYSYSSFLQFLLSQGHLIEELNNLQSM